MRYSDTLIPDMTSNNAPSGVASASSNYSSYPAWQAFSTKGIQWLTKVGQNTGWLQYTFTKKQKINQYTILPSDTVRRSPQTWTFEGSNDGTTWAILDERINETTWYAGVTNKYEFQNDEYFLMYRINVSKNNGDGYVGIVFMGMMEIIYDNKFLLWGMNEKKLFSIKNSNEIVHLENVSEDNFFNYGIDIGTAIDLSSMINKSSYSVNENESLDTGKIFKQKIEPLKTQIKSISIK
ncbi:hypothetical protein [Paenibacillus lentus]|uniref:hypothetical protein n=1 Tax=Paenibacillus lentus TaxID=1338368 RepID=UPI0036D28F1F